MIEAGPADADESSHPDNPELGESDSNSLAGLRRFCHPYIAIGLTALLLAAAVARFVVPSPMWLDEALSVNISRLSLGQIAAHLHHDGHPPLYYALLHFWMELFGSGDRAARSLSGAITVIGVPAIWYAVRRVHGTTTAWAAAVVFGLSPFVLRYGSEARMYALLLVEVSLGYVAVLESLRRPSRRAAAGVAFCTATLLWTHYWSIWLLGSVAALLIVRWIVAHRRGDGDAQHAATITISALVVGGVLFLPWLPTMLYQFHHTGTPWAKPLRPTSMVYASLVEFAGGPHSEAQLLMLMMVLLAFVGLFGRSVDRRHIQLDLATRIAARPAILTLVGVLLIASVMGLAAGMAYAPRYASVFFPLMVVLVSMGIAVVPRPSRDVVLVVFALLSLVGLAVVFGMHRSQSRVVADAIRAHDPTAFVVACPDQLGPSLSRELTGPGYEIRSYPRLDDPRYVDWVDYAQRNARNRPRAVADDVLRRAGDRPIVVVYRDGFLTIMDQCKRMVAQISTVRPMNSLVVANGDTYYEPMNAVSFAAEPLNAG